MRHFLGLDSSTQSLSAIVIDLDSGAIVLDTSINYGDALQGHNCPNGFLDNADSLIRHADPLMWVAALDRLLADCRDGGFDWSSVAAISGSGQQHGTVYLNKRYAASAAGSLVEQVTSLLARSTSPIWMDSSTSAECAEIAAAVGGDEYVVPATGSRMIERFSGSQIRKFSKESPDAYANTARIHLVSSFLASVLIGADAPIDFGDGAGMNLLNLASGAWDAKMLEATAPGLLDKLPPTVPSSTQVGEIAGYFCEQYGFRSGTPVLACSGDNPCSLVGMAASTPGSAVVSLGTSDTFFAAMREPKTDPSGCGHVFGNPAGGFMSLICFKNGSLTREHVANKLGLSWDAFSDAILHDTVPGNNGNLMLPYLESEITPVILDPELKLIGSDAFTGWQDKAACARAVVEAQAISMRLHSAWIDETPTTLLATGGAARNRGLLQVFADVFGACVQRSAVANSVALGAALRAAHACADVEWPELFTTFAAHADEAEIEPDPASATVYDEMTERFATELKTTFSVRIRLAGQESNFITSPQVLA
jgi:xylulokinase